MVVAQLVERLLLTPEVRGSNPVIGIIYIERLLSTVLKRQKERKVAENGPFLEISTESLKIQRKLSKMKVKQSCGRILAS